MEHEAVGGLLEGQAAAMRLGEAWPMSRDEAAKLSPVVLAYVGDAVYELLVRTAGVRRGLSSDRLHRAVVQWVSADGQERVWQEIEGLLSPEEAEIARRGRNAKGGVPHKMAPATYRRSTALEALIGYLYLTGEHGRITELIATALTTVAGGGTAT